MERAPPGIATEQRCSNDEAGEGRGDLRSARVSGMWAAIRGGAWSEEDGEVQSTAPGWPPAGIHLDGTLCEFRGGGA